MTSPAMRFRVNLEMGKEFAHKWEQASYSQTSAYCLNILNELGFPSAELPLNLQTREEQLNFIAGFASYALGEVQNVQSAN
ncbi:hypothetical protein [Nostoc sp. FACHB-110]|uniref:hypothetical protein n=1 Tax=Nostoc sp. FACHB-110 TaxID=2692834 RepID=UPI00168274E2|nr:hypothetical protein [Nostoc sp. FACHB-110]MBD2439862.1 hypothetical protein [Nostoc sp. FACHB-110]